ncbi:unnamed protein product [Meloidogyne enterolobii]|uniref:Uncharacterized protein n=1 Tax=Meloidogyne enterolobii TaxID=390850 RepID=A0ACB1AS86_MELEN
MTTSLRMLSNGNQLFIGIALGIFLGLCISMFDDDYFLTVNIHTPDPFFNILPSQLIKERRKQQRNLTLRCIVLLTSGERQKPEKEFSAILDTWGRDCKECKFYNFENKINVVIFKCCFSLILQVYNNVMLVKISKIVIFMFIFKFIFKFKFYF